MQHIQFYKKIIFQSNKIFHSIFTSGCLTTCPIIILIIPSALLWKVASQNVPFSYPMYIQTKHYQCINNVIRHDRSRAKRTIPFVRRPLKNKQRQNPYEKRRIITSRIVGPTFRLTD